MPLLSTESDAGAQLTDIRTAFRTCPLCEATCGLEIELRGDRVVRIRGDAEDVFSHGFICPKGSTLKQLQDDPDRLRHPQLRDVSGDRAVGWDEAFAEVERRLGAIWDEHGRDAVAIYVGNPNVHNLAGGLYLRGLLRALGTKNVYSASTVDQMPKHVSSGYMFGRPGTIPVPDIDRTDYLLMLGADPYESNGSLATAPDFPGRLEALRERGGRLVVVDPRRSKTARHADEHVFIRPGTDAMFLAAIVNTLFAESLVSLGRLEGMVAGVQDVCASLDAFTAAAVEAGTGVPAQVTQRIARELAEAERAVAYGRVGTHTVEFGTLASWLVDVINVLTGNLDSPGGAMFPHPAHARAHSGPGGRGFATGRWHSRVRGLPEVLGELPVATLADEILTEGEGQVRALVTVAGNPVLSTPDSDRLDEALASLEFMVSVDPYRNETTRHADVVLPPPPPLERSHYDVAFYTLSVRNIANYSAPVIDLDPEGLPEWVILGRMAAIASGFGAATPVDAIDDFTIRQVVERDVRDVRSPVFGRDVDELISALAGRRGPERILDFLIRTGPHGDGFESGTNGLSLAELERRPHGIDLGALEPAFPDAITTPSGMVELAPEPILDDVPRLEAALDRRPNGELLLIGRRQVRSNNSWMHNIRVLVSGAARCTLLVNPDDASALGLEDGCTVTVTSRVGKITAPVEVSEDMMRGVVSLPHGWGHDKPGTRMAVAAANAGSNANALTDATRIDPLSGNAVLNGIPVYLAPV